MNARNSQQLPPVAHVAAEGLSLRDRKKAETRYSIAHATVEAILDQGVELATITTICERAGVSQRTFHNYFPHREAAVWHYLQTLLGWLCEAVKVTEPGLEPLDLAESLAKRFYNNPENPLLSMSALGRLVSVLHGLDLGILEELINQDVQANAAEESPRDWSPGERFTLPLVESIRGYYGSRIDFFTATMLMHTLLMVCHSVWELSQDQLLSGGRPAEAMIQESFKLLRSGFSLSDAT